MARIPRLGSRGRRPGSVAKIAPQNSLKTGRRPRRKGKELKKAEPVDVSSMLCNSTIRAHLPVATRGRVVASGASRTPAKPAESTIYKNKLKLSSVSSRASPPYHRNDSRFVPTSSDEGDEEHEPPRKKGKISKPARVPSEEV